MEDTSRQQPLFRWSAGYVEWLLEPEDQIAAIRDLLQIQLKRVWALSLEANDIVVEFIAEGTWNRAFKVTLPPGLSLPFPTKDQYQHQYCRHLVFRLSLPVRHHTTIPVPRVFLYDATGHTYNGYEWILMEHMPGQRFASLQDKLPLESKVALARTIADWVHSLWSIPFDGIGSLYDDAADGGAHNERDEQHDDGIAHTDCGPVAVSVMDLYGTPPLGTAEQKPVVRLGPLCAQQYMGDWRPEYPFPRGPFRDLRHFCHSFLDVVRYELRDIRQEQRAYIWELCGDLHYTDIEYQIKRPNTPSCQVKYMQRRLNEETPEDKCERQKELVRHKAELVRVYKELSANTQPDSNIVSKLMESYHACGGEVEEPVDVIASVGRPLSEHSSTTAGHEYIWKIDPLGRLVEAAVPDGHLPPKTCILHHWDISENNVLIDPVDGHATALLDWEQIFTVPILPLIAAALPEKADSNDSGSTAAIASDCDGLSSHLYEKKPYGSWLSEQELQPGWWKTGLEIHNMRMAYKARLKELNSPDMSFPSLSELATSLPDKSSHMPPTQQTKPVIAARTIESTPPELIVTRNGEERDHQYRHPTTEDAGGREGSQDVGRPISEEKTTQQQQHSKFHAGGAAAVAHSMKPMSEPDVTAPTLSPPSLYLLQDKDRLELVEKIIFAAKDPYHNRVNDLVTMAQKLGYRVSSSSTGDT
ncbi:hypothetical protein PG995_012109 [Apiospora arundinis]